MNRESVDQRSPAHAEPVSRTYQSQGLRLHYLDWGNDSAPLLLFVHGIRDHAHSWDWTARALHQDWHVVCLDLRGHGDSQWSADGAYLCPHHLEDLAGLVDSFGDKPLSIVAHSFGGAVVARYAAIFPQRVRKLAIVDGFGPSDEAVARWTEAGPTARTRQWLEKRRETAAAKPRRFAALEEAIARMAAANQHLSAEQARHLAVHGVRQYADGYGWKYDPHIGNFLPEDFAVDLVGFWREINAPTLICWGTESFTSNPAADGKALYFRNRQIRIFDQAGHWLHHDQHEAFVSALREFL